MFRNKFFVDSKTNVNTIAVVKTRAKFLNCEVIVGDFKDYTFTNDVCGALVQYPNTEGSVVDYSEFIQSADQAKVLTYVYMYMYFRKTFLFISSLHIQWNLAIPVTLGTNKRGRISQVAGLVKWLD